MRPPDDQAAIYVNGTTGDDTAAGSQDAPLKTLGEAFRAARTAGVTTVVANGSLADATSIPSGMTLEIASNTTSSKDLTVSNGATLKVDQGAVLTINGATLNVAGTVQGWGKDNLAVDITTTGKGLGLNGSTKFADVYLRADVNGDNQQGFTATNSTIETHGLWGYIATEIKLDSSTYSIDGDKWGTSSSYSGQGMTIAEGGFLTMENGSLLKVSNIHGRSWRGGQGISVGSGAKDFLIKDSTLEFQNCATSGLNLNSSATTVTLENSVIKGQGQSGALYGVQAGRIVFTGSGLMETPAARGADTGAGGSGRYVVLGGSFLQTYDPSYYSSYGSIRPTNGSDYGNEQLSLFTLADSSVTSLTVVSSNGTSYTYDVANASSDGAKHVWVPAEDVSFVLNAADAADQVAASFSDGSTAAVTRQAMRGSSLGAASKLEGGQVAMPADPVALGYTFEGWFCKDANGNEQAFTDATPVNAPLTVYAKWKGDSSSYGVVYHNNLSDDATFVVSGANPNRSINIVGIDQVAAQNSAFATGERIFQGWNTKADGTGEVVDPGSYTVPEDVPVLNLYAQWKERTVTVTFSANGGTFADDSVFKANPDVFEIITDDRGGEAAVVKKQAVVSDRTTLNSLLGAASDGSLGVNTAGIRNPVNTSANAAAPAAYRQMATRKYKVLDEKIEPVYLLIWRTGDNHYFWFADPDGTATADMSGILSEDVTYYLKWADDPGVEDVTGTSSLPADLTSRGATSSIPEVAMSGSGQTGLESADVVGVVDVTSILTQMDAIEEKYGTRDNIALDQLSSSFTATLTIPDGLVVPDNAQVTTNLGKDDLFVATIDRSKPGVITIKFDLNPNVDLSTYDMLHGAVESLVTSKGGKLTVTVDTVKVDESKQPANGQKMTVLGTVDGSFDSYAVDENGTVKHFTFTWVGAQTADGQDPEVTNAIAQTFQVLAPINSTLNADILIGDETEHTQVYPVVVGQSLDYTGALDVSSIVNQMHGVEALYPGVATDDYDDITLSGMSSEFTASIQVPEGLVLPSGLLPADIVTEGFADAFTVTGVAYADNASKITVTMSLKDGIDTYQELYDAVSAVGNSDGWMKVTVPGVKVADGTYTGENKNLTVLGKVQGQFVGTATHKGKVRHFWFTWQGVQNEGGTDFIHQGAAQPAPLSFTVAPQQRVQKTLVGDLRIVDNGEEVTQHDAVFVAKKGQSYPFVGALKVDSIREQMSGIEAEYGKVPASDYDQIALDDVDFEFTASLTLPKGMSFSQKPDLDSVTLADAKGFKVKGVEVSDDGMTATVRFGLDSDVTTYAQLRDIVMGAGDSDGWMRITVPGVKVGDDVVYDTPLTVYGKVEGSFQARAIYQGVSKAFAFDWTAEQWSEGSDSLFPDSDEISLSLMVQRPADPTPDPGSTPGSPSEPVKGKGGIPGTGDIALPVVVSAAMIAVAGVALTASARVRRED